MFPEGTRSPDGAIHEFKSGAGYLALRGGCDVLPVRISGTYEVLGKGSIIPHRRPVEVRIGRVITNAELRALADNAEGTGATIASSPTRCARRCWNSASGYLPPAQPSAPGARMPRPVAMAASPPEPRPKRLRRRARRPTSRALQAGRGGPPHARVGEPRAERPRHPPMRRRPVDRRTFSG